MATPTTLAGYQSLFQQAGAGSSQPWAVSGNDFYNISNPQPELASGMPNPAYSSPFGSSFVDYHLSSPYSGQIPVGTKYDDVSFDSSGNVIRAPGVVQAGGNDWFENIVQGLTLAIVGGGMGAAIGGAGATAGAADTGTGFYGAADLASPSSGLLGAGGAGEAGAAVGGGGLFGSGLSGQQAFSLANTLRGVLGGQTGTGGGTIGAGGNMDIAQLLQQLLGGGQALNNLFGSGSTSSAGQMQAAAAAADPFAAQRSQYQQALPGALAGYTNTANAAPRDFLSSAGGAAQFAMQPPVSGALTANTGAATLNPALGATAGTSTIDPSLMAMVSGNDPSYQFRFQQGIDALNRGAAQSGTLASGKQMTELEQYGQNFASQEYAADVARKEQLQQTTMANQAQNFGQQSTLQQLMQGVQQQNFGQQMNLQNLLSNRNQLQFQDLLGGAQFGQQQQTGQASQQAALLQLLGGFAGAGSGSPAEAGKILSGAQQNQTDALAQLQNALGGPTGSSGPGGNGLISLLQQLMGSGGADTTQMINDLMGGGTGIGGDTGAFTDSNNFGLPSTVDDSGLIDNIDWSSVM